MSKNKNNKDCTKNISVLRRVVPTILSWLILRIFIYYCKWLQLRKWEAQVRAVVSSSKYLFNWTTKTFH